MLNENCNNDDLVYEAQRLIAHFNNINDFEAELIVSTLLERLLDYRDLVDETHILLDTVNKYEKDDSDSPEWDGLYDNGDDVDEYEEDE